MSTLIVIVSIVLSFICAPQAFAFGEDVLAATGQYTFFIRSKCEPNVLYYQKMVPCIADGCPLPRQITNRYQVPVADLRKEFAKYREVPVGCPPGCGDCMECFPKESKYSGYNDIVGPRPIPAEISSVVPVPNPVRQHVMAPQWFAVYETKRQPARKVQAPEGDFTMPPAVSWSR